MRVEQIMTRNIQTCAPGDSLNRAMQLMANQVHACDLDDDTQIALERMRSYQLRRLPVTDANGCLVGLVSLNDLALEALRECGPGRHALRMTDIAETLAQIGTHRGPARLVLGA